MLYYNYYYLLFFTGQSGACAGNTEAPAAVKGDIGHDRSSYSCHSAHQSHQTVIGTEVIFLKVMECFLIKHVISQFFSRRLSRWFAWETTNILRPYERLITLVIWHWQRLVGDFPFHLKFALKVTHPFNNANCDRFPIITSSSNVLETGVVLWLDRCWKEFRSSQ